MQSRRFMHDKPWLSVLQAITKVFLSALCISISAVLTVDTSLTMVPGVSSQEWLLTALECPAIYEVPVGCYVQWTVWRGWGLTRCILHEGKNMTGQLGSHMVLYIKNI